jgi:hypothetical protein
MLKREANKLVVRLFVSIVEWMMMSLRFQIGSKKSSQVQGEKKRPHTHVTPSRMLPPYSTVRTAPARQA